MIRRAGARICAGMLNSRARVPHVVEIVPARSASYAPVAMGPRTPSRLIARRKRQPFSAQLQGGGCEILKPRSSSPCGRILGRWFEWRRRGAQQRIVERAYILICEDNDLAAQLACVLFETFSLRVHPRADRRSRPLVDGDQGMPGHEKTACLVPTCAPSIC